MNITIPKISEKTLALPSGKEILKGLTIIALARARLWGMAPLGLAFAATLPLGSSYIGLLGLAAGMADSGAAGLKYIFSYLIYYILVYIRKSQKEKSRAITLGTVLFINCAIGLWVSGTSLRAPLLCIPEALVCASAYLLFCRLSDNTPVSRVAELVAVGGALCGLSGVTIPYLGVNASLFAAIFIAMSLCYACTPPVAVFASASLGFVMNLSSPEAVMLCGGYALSAACASLLSGMGRVPLSVGFLCGITATALYRGNISGISPLDIFAPLLFFVILPEGIHYKIGSFINSRLAPDFESADTDAVVAQRLRTVAAALFKLGEEVSLAPDQATGTRTISEQISSRVCRNCSLFESCWKTDRTRTIENMHEIWETMERDGFCDSSNMPSRFRQSCVLQESLLCEFRHAYELAKQNALLWGEAGCDRDIMAKQYAEISRVLERMSLEAESGFAPALLEAPRFLPKITVLSEPKPGNTFCGDTVTHFIKDNKCFVILCDGMGSGDAAKNQSRLASRLFEELLKAGFEKNIAVNMINSALALKSDRESFSTADILEIDLESGMAEFLKIGSAQSIVKSKKGIEVISSKSLPIGILERIETEPVRCVVNYGDLILMLSDGVGEAGSGILKNEWIKKLLLLENRNDEELARLILSGARSRSRYSDDMTCCIVRIKKA